MVAVDALAVLLETAEYVVVDDTLVVVLQAALVDGQCLVGDIRRCYQAVADIGVDGVWRDKDAEGLEACPLVAVTCIDLYRDGITLGFLCQFTPFVDGGPSVSHDAVIAYGIARYHLVGLAIIFKTQWCHIHRYCHLRIVRIDGRPLV